MVCSKSLKKNYLEYVDARDVAAVSIIFETIPLCSSLYDSYGKKIVLSDVWPQTCIKFNASDFLGEPVLCIMKYFWMVCRIHTTTFEIGGWCQK